MHSRAVTWDLGMLPFQVGHQSSPSNDPLPDRLPFVVGVDEQTGLIVQHRDRHVSRTLADAYRLGSQMGTPLKGEGMGSSQLGDVRAFIEESLPDGDLEGLAVLEIGCGDGALLEQLAHQGARVVGVEPGAVAAAGAWARRLEVHCEPFMASRFDGKRFDLIVHHTVLEHIEEPIEFIADQLRLLAPGGRIICCVPDCAPALEHGDLSMLVHEHWSYFNAQTLGHLASTAGARTLAWRNATTEGAIYCAWEQGSPARMPPPSPPPYIDRGRHALREIEAFVARMARSGSSLGIFPGGRWVNYHALLVRTLSALPATRWFDDDPALHGRFYPPVDIAVGARAALIAHPVDELLIASWTFGEALRDELAQEATLAATTIHTFSDLLEGREAT
jgi:2-polyprenyl-3-methyl-5-hydroxy-6-metoxy-1,4-benzoquinol methylase